jgi:hypothetical protein
MYQQIIAHLQGMTNLETALIVVLYGVAVSFLCGGVASILRVFRPATVHNHYD